MSKHRFAAWALVTIAAVLPWTASGQGRPDTATLLAAQRAAMAPFAYMDGVWRGPAWTLQPSGEKHNVTQTERIGPFLDGTVKVIEGRGYNEDGKVGFNALGIVSYNPDTKAYSIRSYALGHVGDFVLTQNADGFVWEIPAGPATIRYTAVVKDGKWHEVGDRIVSGQEPSRFFEMTLKRAGDSSWPGAGAVSAK